VRKRILNVLLRTEFFRRFSSITFFLIIAIVDILLEYHTAKARSSESKDGHENSTGNGSTTVQKMIPLRRALAFRCVQVIIAVLSLLSTRCCQTSGSFQLFSPPQSPSSRKRHVVGKRTACNKAVAAPRFPSSSSSTATFVSIRKSRFNSGTDDDNNSGGGGGSAGEGPFPRGFGHSRRERREWLEQATSRLISAPVGSLDKGKWHEVVSMFGAWSAYSKKDPTKAPLRMEALLKRLLDERAVRPEIGVSIGLYNRLLDAWACSALFWGRARSDRERTKENDGNVNRRAVEYNPAASQRAREILVSLQEAFESSQDASIQPTRESFEVVLHAVCRTEGPLVARRVLAWMEHLVKTGKNREAQPTRSDYVLVLDAYANLNNNRNLLRGDGIESLVTTNADAGMLAEGFLRHMKSMGVEPDTVCYNICIKAFTKTTRTLGPASNHNHRGREAAEHADRILETMEADPDLCTYATVISSWAASGMRSHAVARVEELLQQIKDRDLLGQVNGVAATPSYTVCLNAVMSAWVKSRNPKAVERTEELLREMEADGANRPDLISYNTHLHALSMHSDKRSEYADRAECILIRLEAMIDSGDVGFGPNLFSYNLVIDAFCRANQSMRAAGILKKLIKRAQPDTFSFNQVLTSLSRSSVKDAPRIAEELLVYMEAAYKSGVHPRARPDVFSYAAVIFAESRSGDPAAAERAQALLNLMKKRATAGEKHLKPNRYCYNAVIAAWGTSGKGTFGARKAEALLQEMQELLEAGDKSVAPNIVTYNSVLHAWARSGTRCCGYKAETYLNRMWELYNAGDKKVKPNDLSYNTVINAISRSQHEGKAQKALRLLRQMDRLYQAGNKEARPNEVTYTAVLNSCAFPAVPDPRTCRKALDTAIFTLKELQSSRYGHPNQVTYGTFDRSPFILQVSLFRSRFLHYLFVRSPAHNRHVYASMCQSVAP